MIDNSDITDGYCKTLNPYFPLLNKIECVGTDNDIGITIKI